MQARKKKKIPKSKIAPRFIRSGVFFCLLAREIDVYRTVGDSLMAIEKQCHCEESPGGADVAISFRSGACAAKWYDTQHDTSGF